MNSNIVFVILIICFEYLQSISFKSFTQEFFLCALPFLILVKPIFIDRNFIFFDRRVIFLLIFNFVCFLSLFWTTDIKYTLATLGESNLAILTTIFVLNYTKQNQRIITH